MRLFRRKPRLREIDETEAYDRSYGDPSRDVKIVKLPPRRPRHREVLASGDRLRRAFLDRLESRDEEKLAAAEAVVEVEETKGSA